MRINMIPRAGRQQLQRRRCSAPRVNSSFQSNNYTDELKAAGLRDARHHQAQLRLQSGGRRSAHAGQAVVLLVGALRRQRELRRRHRRQHERRQSERLDLRAGSTAVRGCIRLTQESVNVRLTLAGEREEQVQRLLRRPVALLVQAARCANISPESASTYTFPIENLAIVHLVVAADQPAADRGERVAPRRAVRGRQAAGRRRVPDADPGRPNSRPGCCYRGVGTGRRRRSRSSPTRRRRRTCRPR